MRMSRTTLASLATALAVALLAPPAARADEAAGHYNLCVQFKREGKIPEAIAECQKAISARADYAAAHRSLGNLYRAQGNYELAAGEFEKTTKLQPKAYFEGIGAREPVAMKKRQTSPAKCEMVESRKGFARRLE